MRSRTASRPPKYSVNIGGEPSSLGMLQQAWSRSRKELISDGNELRYLLTKLEKIEEMSVTEQEWRDFSETWQSLLALRAQMSTQMSQTVIDCILADRKVAEALGMAEALKGIVGNPPTELIARLNQGPGRAHPRACLPVQPHDQGGARAHRTHPRAAVARRRPARHGHCRALCRHRQLYLQHHLRHSGRDERGDRRVLMPSTHRVFCVCVQCDADV